MPKGCPGGGTDGKEAPLRSKTGNLFLPRPTSVGYAVSPCCADKPANKLNVNGTQSRSKKRPLRVSSTRLELFPAFRQNLNQECYPRPPDCHLADVPKQYLGLTHGFRSEQAAASWYVSGPAQIRHQVDARGRVSPDVNAQGRKNSTSCRPLGLSAGDAGNRVEFGQRYPIGEPWLPT